jgi:hypothetical protein
MVGFPLRASGLFAFSRLARLPMTSSQAWLEQRRQASRQKMVKRASWRMTSGSAG